MPFSSSETKVERIVISPAPVDAETWVAVLTVIARRLMDGGYDAAAVRVYEAIAEFQGQQ